MKSFNLSVVALALLAVGAAIGCTATATKSPDVTDTIRTSLDQAGFKNVTVSQDRDKGIVTLGGQVGSESDKARVETLAKSFAGAQVVANQTAVLPAGGEKDAKAVDAAIDAGIGNNLDATLLENKMHDSVKFDVKIGVVTLSGEVGSPNTREHAEKLAASVPNVTQVVNDLQVKNQKASSKP